MEIASLILLALIAALLLKIKLGFTFFAASSEDWIVLEWHKIRDAGTDKAMWDAGSPMHIEFVPVIGWAYDHWGYKHGKPTPITPPHYRVRARLNVGPLDRKAEYETFSYWIRKGEVYNISQEWDSGDFWENLSRHTVAGVKTVVHGNVPECCRKRLFQIIAVSEQKQKEENS